MRFPLLVSASLLLASAFALAIPVEDNPSDADRWFDITVLKAHVRSDWTLKAFDQVEHCQKVRDAWVDSGRQGKHHEESFDCTDYIAGRTQATAFKQLPYWNFTDGKLHYAVPLDTPLVEVLTVTPEDSLARASFLGFSESYQGGRVNLFRATGLDGQTREAGKVRLKDGRVGIVHRWIAPFQQNGTAGGGAIRALPFKPVLVRVVDGQHLRYWDRLIGQGLFTDYLITNAHYDPRMHTYVFTAPNVFDRSAELLP